MAPADGDREAPRRQPETSCLDAAPAGPETAVSSEASQEIWAALRDGASAETLALLDELRNPPKRTWASQLGVLAISLFVFVSLGFLQWSATQIVILVVVLLVHEVGHYLAMVAFGYRDIRMFFIPLFGAAVSASGAGVPGYQRTLVALAGPVPGILIALVLAFLFALGGNAAVGYAARMFLAVNAFNLLPLLPLDGGHVLQETVFCRSRWLEAGFQAMAVLGLLLLALAARDLILGLLGLLMLASVRGTFKVSGIAARVRQFPDVPDLRAPSDASLPFLLRIASEAETDFRGANARQRATVVRTVIEKLNPRPPAALATVLLLTAYGMSFLLALVGVLLILVRPSLASIP